MSGTINMPGDSVTEFQKWFSNTPPTDPQKQQIILQANLSPEAADSPFRLLLEAEKGRVLKIWKVMTENSNR